MARSQSAAKITKPTEKKGQRNPPFPRHCPAFPPPGVSFLTTRGGVQSQHHSSSLYTGFSLPKGEAGGALS